MTTPFRPIARANRFPLYSKQEPGVIELDETSQDRITELLMGRKVTKVDGEHLLLDNGTTIRALGHEGGCACSAGDYDLTALNGVDNIITRVEFDYHPAGDDYVGSWADREPTEAMTCPHGPAEDEWTGHYRIFVFAENRKVNLMEVTGSDGNGYYGTGFELLVRLP